MASNTEQGRHHRPRVRIESWGIPLTAALMVSSGCPFIYGEPDLSNVDGHGPGDRGDERLTEIDNDSEPPPDSTSPIDSATTEQAWDWCAEAILSGDPAEVTGNTAGGEDLYTPSCAQSSAPDSAVAFVAPIAGTYRFTTAGSAYNTVLSLLDGCDGEEIACNDDAVGTRAGMTVELDEGQAVIAVIDGFGAGAGGWKLEVRWIPPEDCDNDLDDDFDRALDCMDPDCALEAVCDATCPEETLAGVPSVVVGDTFGMSNDGTPPCTYSSASDVTVAFTAPEDGSYVFDTFGSGYDTVLVATDGCGGPMLGCNDDWYALQSQLVVDLLEGQLVVLAVDGYASNSGSYQLHVRSEQVCDDLIDDDGDTRVDCADLECADDPACSGS